MYVEIVISLSPLNKLVSQILAQAQLAVKLNVLIGLIEVIYQDTRRRAICNFLPTQAKSGLEWATSQTPADARTDLEARHGFCGSGPGHD